MLRIERAVGPTVAAYLFEGMSAFELGCVTEVFALPRPELDVPWYEFKACAETRRPLRALGGFSLSAEHGMDEFTAAETLIVTAVPDVHGEIPAGLIAALRKGTSAGRASSPSVRGRSPSPRRGCWTGWARRRTGGTRTCSGNAIRPCGWIRTCCTWTRAGC